MEYRRLGQCGLKVSELCLGTMAFGNKADEAESKRIVDLAFDGGINFFDTADVYSAGVSERMLGQAVLFHVVVHVAIGPAEQGPQGPALPHRIDRKPKQIDDQHAARTSH